MAFNLAHPYRGPVRAVVLDWAGTTVDYGCRAPTAVFVQTFAARGIDLTPEQARGPMGLMKRDHIRHLLQLPSVAEQWRRMHGRPADEADIEDLYQEFIPLQLAILADYADPIPGAVEFAAYLRQRGLKVGSTTGYNREMMELLAPEAARRGYAPDTWVCSTDVPAGRPYPWMMYQNAMNLGVYPPEALVKIGDTVPDIDEGLNAGAWTVGVALTGNEMGLGEDELAALPKQTLDERLDKVRRRLVEAGAHYVIDDLKSAAEVIEAVDARLAHGEKP